MEKRSKATLLVNTFGALGYIFCFMLWGWIGILFVPMILENERVQQLLLPTQIEPAATPAHLSDPSPFMMLIAALITVIVLIATIAVLLRAPIAIANAGKTITAKAATSTVPLVTRHQPMPKAKKKRLTADLIKLTKLLLILVPVAATSLGFFIELPLPFELAMLFSSILSLVSLLWFFLQYVSAKVLSVDATLIA